MDHTFCPGSKLLRQPAPETFTCPSCGAEVEIWTDEIKGRCLRCDRTVFRDSGMSCLDWCKYGEECVGEAVYENHVRNKIVGIKQRLLHSLEERFGKDNRTVDRSKRVLHFAEELLQERNADRHIVIPASILYGVRETASDERDASFGSRQPWSAKPFTVRSLLLGLGFKIEDIDEISAIIGADLPPEKRETPNYVVVRDAICLADLDEIARGKTRAQLLGIIDDTFRTERGKNLAKELLLKQTV